MDTLISYLLQVQPLETRLYCGQLVSFCFFADAGVVDRVVDL
jgi:hypothetical protein